MVDTEANCERNQKDGGEMHARKGGMQMRSPAGCKRWINFLTELVSFGGGGDMSSLLSRKVNALIMSETCV